jgi:hypothetical protein
MSALDPLRTLASELEFAHERRVLVQALVRLGLLANRLAGVGVYRCLYALLPCGGRALSMVRPRGLADHRVGFLVLRNSALRNVHGLFLLHAPAHALGVNVRFPTPNIPAERLLSSHCGHSRQRPNCPHYGRSR